MLWQVKALLRSSSSVLKRRIAEAEAAPTLPSSFAMPLQMKSRAFTAQYYVAEPVDRFKAGSPILWVVPIGGVRSPDSTSQGSYSGGLPPSFVAANGSRTSQLSSEGIEHIAF
jgi:hypothetical protein